jgi:hypothetical protein
MLGSKAHPGTGSASDYARDLREAVNRMENSGPQQSVIGQGGISNKGTQLLGPLPSDKPPLPPSMFPPFTERELDASALILEGEVAWLQLKAAPTFENWLKVGRALLILQQQAIVEAKAYKGIKYAHCMHALLARTKLCDITKSSRQTAMLIVRYYHKGPEDAIGVEDWLKGLDDEERLGKNHPVVIWSGYRAFLGKRINRARDRHPTKPVTVQQIIAALKRWFPDNDVEDYRSCAHEVMHVCNLAVPRSEYRRNGAEAHG